MARIRTIKPSFWSDAGVARLSRDARLLALGLISFADDEGRFIASLPAIRGYVYPHDEDVTDAKVKRWIGEIAKHLRLELYSVDGLPYGQWERFVRTPSQKDGHQVIQHPQSSTLPPPPADGLFDA